MKTEMHKQTRPELERNSGECDAVTTLLGPEEVRGRHRTLGEHILAFGGKVNPYPFEWGEPIGREIL